MPTRPVIGNFPFNATILAWLMLSIGCDSPNAADDTTVVVTARAALTDGYAAASIFNHAGLRHTLGGGGVEVDHTRDGKPIKTYDASHAQLGEVPLRDGTKLEPIRMQTLEAIDIDGKRLFRVWAHETKHDGWVESDDVAVKTNHGPEVGSLALHEEPSAAAGNGASCESHGVPLLTDSAGQPVQYVVDPQAVDKPADPDLHWEIDSSYGWLKFSPDWDKPAAPSPFPNRVFLMWSWTPTDDDGNVHGFTGGGVARTEMRATEHFIPCMVAPIRSVLREVADKAPGPSPSAHRMTVFGAYGKYTSRTRSFYGWTILASSLNATGYCKMHLKCEGDSAKCPLLPSLPTKCHF